MAIFRTSNQTHFINLIEAIFCVEKFKNQNEVAIKLETLTNFADASFFCFGKCYN